MDEKFQDRIDDFLLNRMNAAEKAAFLQDVEQDAEKKKQLEFTQNVKNAIRSREDKLKALSQFRQQYADEQKARAVASNRTKKTWLWLSGVAALLIVGFFAIKPIFDQEPMPGQTDSPVENMRGGDDVFSPTPADTTVNDTINDIEHETTSND